MARIQPIDYEHATEKVKSLLDAVHAKFGMTPNLITTMAQSPTVLEAYLGFSGTLAGGRLSGKLREQLALVTAAVNDCGYCAAAHTAIGRSVGLGEEAITAAREASASDPKADAALKFARTVIVNRGEISDSEVTALRAAGFDDGEVVEIVAHVALNIFTNYFNHIAGTEIDFPRVPVRAAA